MTVMELQVNIINIIKLSKIVGITVLRVFIIKWLCASTRLRFRDYKNSVGKILEIKWNLYIR